MRLPSEPMDNLPTIPPPSSPSPPDPLALAHTSWLQPFVSYFDERGTDLQDHYSASKISPEVVRSGDGWITKKQLYRLLDRLARRENVPELGFTVGERLDHTSMGVIGQEIDKSNTLGDALRTFCRLIPRHVEGNEAWVEPGENGQAWLLHSTSTDIGSPIADHAGLMSLINIVRLAAGPEWYPAQLQLQTPATNGYRRIPGLAGSVIEFDMEATGFSFPAILMLKPISGRPQPVTAADHHEGLLAPGESAGEKLSRLLGAILGTGGLVPTLEMMSELTDVSTRTLHRRLNTEGLSYQELLDRARFDRAKELLCDTDMSVKQLAFELGYSGANNFIRAFRRLSGQTPGAFRRESRPQLAS